MSTTIINLLGGPGSGKSTTAAGLFHTMKLSEFKVELVTEYAKDLTYEGRQSTLDNQLYVFAKQLHRIERIKNQVDYIITDSPIILACLYAPSYYPSSFEQLVMDFWKMDDNKSFFISRDKKYQKYGRKQSLDEAKEIDSKIQFFLLKNNINFQTINGDPYAHIEILKYLNIGIVSNEEQ